MPSRPASAPRTPRRPRGAGRPPAGSPEPAEPLEPPEPAAPAREGLLPPGFRFGVATAGFQVEGGFNGPGEPRNNWYAWEQSGRVEPSGVALDFWNRYAEHLDRATALGIDSFRLSVEWARVEPREGEIDTAALEHYGDILRACRERGLEPLVTLLHFTHPAWLGEEFWTGSEAPERFASFARLVVERLGDACRNWVTLNETNILALMSYLLGAFPPGRRLDFAATRRAADHLLAAHVLAYDALKSVQPDAVVSTNNCAFSVYELDRLGTDLLLARSRGVGRDEVGAHLSERRAVFYTSPAGLGAPGPAGRSTRRHPLLEQALRALAERLVDAESCFPRTLDALYASPHPRPLDVVQLDYYDPETANHLALPGSRTAGGRVALPQRPLWDDPPNPAGLAAYCAAGAEPGLEVWVVENGMCNRVRRGRSYPRLDGWDRPRYLRANLGAILEAVEAGVPVGGYWHWSLVDNYEWGSYEPRFGLYGVDRERGLRWSELDSMGHDAAGAYRDLIAALRAGDRSAFA
jgi:beta-glucosidase